MSKLYLPGKTEVFAKVVDSRGGSKWPELRAELAELLDVREDDVDMPDLYWGGEHGDENSVDAVVVKGEILAVLNHAVTLDELAAIYAAASNDHVKFQARFKAPSPAPLAIAAE